jgi:hypothetical protein
MVLDDPQTYSRLPLLRTSIETPVVRLRQLIGRVGLANYPREDRLRLLHDARSSGPS